MFFKKTRKAFGVFELIDIIDFILAFIDRSSQSLSPFTKGQVIVDNVCF